MNIEDYIQRFQDGGSPLSADLPETPDARQARRSGLFAPKFQDGGSPMDPSNPLYITSDPEYSPAALSDMVRKEVRFDPSQYPVEEPSLAQVSMDRLKDMGQGFADIPGFVGNYLVRPDEQGDPSFVSSTDVMSDVVGLGSGMASAIAEDPLGSFLDVIPGVSNYRSLDAANDLYDQASELDKEGDQLGAAKMRSLASFSMTDVFNPIPGSALGVKGIIAAGMAKKGPQKLNDQRLDQLESTPDKALEQEVFRDTGSFIGAGGKRQFEIDTSSAKVDLNKFADMYMYGTPKRLPEVLDFPELFENYPQLLETQVVLDSNLPGSGQYRLQKDEIAINPNYQEYGQLPVTSTLLHEVQHGVQNIEGYLDRDIFYEGDISHDEYMRLPTEVESRNVQLRLENPNLRDRPPSATAEFSPEEFSDVDMMRERANKQAMDDFMVRGGIFGKNPLDDFPAFSKTEDTLEEIMERLKEKVVNTPNVPRETPTRAPLPEAQVVDPYEYPADTRYRQNNPKR